MRVTELEESVVRDIGHAFGYYDYGDERGMVSAFSGPAAADIYIQGYARGMAKGGFLYTTGERQEGFIAYKLPKEKIGLRTLLPLMQGLFRAMRMKELLRFAKNIKRGGPSLRERMDREKKPYIFVGMVCVREACQRQGYMRKVMELAFSEGDRLGVPVVLETDARSKCDRYVHLGMELAGTRSAGENGEMFDLIRYPDAACRK